jgi:hypothetical protein
MIFPLACVQTSSEAHPASYPMDTGGPFQEGKARPGRDAGHSPPSSAGNRTPFARSPSLLSDIILTGLSKEHDYIIKDWYASALTFFEKHNTKYIVLFGYGFKWIALYLQ